MYSAFVTTSTILVGIMEMELNKILIKLNQYTQILSHTGSNGISVGFIEHEQNEIKKKYNE